MAASGRLYHQSAKQPVLCLGKSKGKRDGLSTQKTKESAMWYLNAGIDFIEIFVGCILALVVLGAAAWAFTTLSELFMEQPLLVVAAFLLSPVWIPLVIIAVPVWLGYHFLREHDYV
jgi:hypothetical protein